MPTPPPRNILLIHSDQHRYDCLSLHDPDRARTPHLDRLAAGGVDFTRAFTPNPVCSPARACLQTGTWATTHGCVTIPHTEAFQSADPDLPVLTSLLAGAGYRIAHVGKFHREVAGGPTDHGAEVFVTGRQYQQWREEQGLPPQPREHGLLGEVDPHIAPEQSSLHWQCDQTLALLAEFAATARDDDAGRPFFLRWDPPEPHLPCVIPHDMADWYPAAEIAPWPSFPDPLEHKPAIQRRTRQRWGVDGWDWERWQPVVSRYLAEIELLDRQVGRLLDALDRLGVAEDTLVVYTTDHGDTCGGHGMIDKHFQMYDDIMHVPLILRLPGVLEPGTACDAFVTHEIDLARTFLAVARVDAPDSFVGRDLIAEARGKAAAPARTDIFAQYQGTHQGLYSERMLRDGRWKYVYNPVSFDELYDLDADPGEIENLIDETEHAATLHRLRERMGDWMREISDPLSPPLWTWDLGAGVN